MKNVSYFSELKECKWDVQGLSLVWYVGIDGRKRVESVMQNREIL